MLFQSLARSLAPEAKRWSHHACPGGGQERGLGLLGFSYLNPRQFICPNRCIAGLPNCWIRSPSNRPSSLVSVQCPVSIVNYLLLRAKKDLPRIPPSSPPFVWPRFINWPGPLKCKSVTYDANRFWKCEQNCANLATFPPAWQYNQPLHCHSAKEP